MTKLLFLTDPYLMETDTKLIDIIETNDNKKVIQHLFLNSKILITEESIFHPQGGGQPSDSGTIETSDNVVFNVEKVSQKDGIVHHVGKFSGDSSVKINDTIKLKIEKDVRLTNLKLHSAGHLIDVAVRNIGYTNWITIKGYHFPQGFLQIIINPVTGAYDEYDINGQDFESNKEDFMIKLQTECDKLIKSDMEVLNKFYDYDSINSIIGNTPEYLPKNQPVRMVTYGGKNGIICPCSGTHVRSNSEIGKIVIRKIQKKGKTVLVKYSC